MKSQFVRIAIAVAALACLQPATAADLVDNWIQDCKMKLHWPKPYLCPDRQTVRQPFAIMVDNGWQRQNSLIDIHFEAGGAQLTEAGRLKILWILNDAPEQHRIVYVRRAQTPQEMAMRMEAAQSFVAHSAFPGQAVPVLETTRPEDNWSANHVELVELRAIKAAPEPKLPRRHPRRNHRRDELTATGYGTDAQISAIAVRHCLDNSR